MGFYDGRFYTISLPNGSRFPGMADRRNVYAFCTYLKKYTCMLDINPIFPHHIHWIYCALMNWITKSWKPTYLITYPVNIHENKIVSWAHSEPDCPCPSVGSDKVTSPNVVRSQWCHYLSVEKRQSKTIGTQYSKKNAPDSGFVVFCLF